VEPFTNSNTPALSIAQVDWTFYGEHELAPPGSKQAAADLLALPEALLAAVTTCVGEVEAAGLPRSGASWGHAGEWPQ
jgi:hypothetical protein